MIHPAPDFPARRAGWRSAPLPASTGAGVLSRPEAPARRRGGHAWPFLSRPVPRVPPQEAPRACGGNPVT